VPGLSEAWTRVFRQAFARACEGCERWADAAATWQELAVDGDPEAHASLQRVRSKLADKEREARQRADELASQRRREAEAEALREGARREAERREYEGRARAAAAAREQEAAELARGKIAAAKTPAGRRSALQAGLAKLTDPPLRQLLLVAAARADVEAVIAKTVDLKTIKAKRRHLEDALAVLKADAVPDDLQVEEIDLLERSLATLEGSP
jgi:hypothetical protein